MKGHDALSSTELRDVNAQKLTQIFSDLGLDIARHLDALEENDIQHPGSLAALDKEDLTSLGFNLRERSSILRWRDTIQDWLEFNRRFTQLEFAAATNDNAPSTYTSGSSSSGDWQCSFVGAATQAVAKAQSKTALLLQRFLSHLPEDERLQVPSDLTTAEDTLIAIQQFSSGQSSDSSKFEVLQALQRLLVWQWLLRMRSERRADQGPVQDAAKKIFEEIGMDDQVISPMLMSYCTEIARLLLPTINWGDFDRTSIEAAIEAPTTQLTAMAVRHVAELQAEVGACCKPLAAALRDMKALCICEGWKVQDMVSYLAACDKAMLETCIGGQDAVDFQSQMGNAYKQCAAFLLGSFDTHAAKSPKKRQRGNKAGASSGTDTPQPARNEYKVLLPGGFERNASWVQTNALCCELANQEASRELCESCLSALREKVAEITQTSETDRSLQDLCRALTELALDVMSRFQNNATILDGCISMLLEFFRSGKMTLGMQTQMHNPEAQQYESIDGDLQTRIRDCVQDALSVLEWQEEAFQLLARTQPAAVVLGMVQSNSTDLDTVLDEVYDGLYHHLENSVRQQSFSEYRKWLLREIALHRSGPRHNVRLNTLNWLYKKGHNDQTHHRRMRCFLIALVSDLEEELLAPLEEQTDRLVVGATYYAISMLFQLDLHFSESEWSLCGRILVTPLPKRDQIYIDGLQDVDCDKMAALVPFFKASASAPSSSTASLMPLDFQERAVGYVLSVLDHWEREYETFNEACAHVLNVGLWTIQNIVGDQELPEQLADPVCRLADKVLKDFWQARWEYQGSLPRVDEATERAKELIKKSPDRHLGPPSF